MSVLLIVAMWQPYLFNNIKYVYTDTGVETWYTCMYTGIHTCIISESW